MKTRKNWTENEIALLRASILNNAEDIQFLCKALGRSEGSIMCQLGRERMTLYDQGYNQFKDPIYTGKTIGYKAKNKITI
jgi:hypothetical protein